MSEEKNIDDNENSDKIASDFVNSIFEKRKIDNDLLIEEQKNLKLNKKQINLTKIQNQDV